MARFLVFLVLSLFVAVSVDSKGCCTPGQWEGTIGQLMMSSRGAEEEFDRDHPHPHPQPHPHHCPHHHGGIGSGLTRLSYDFKNKKIAANVTLFEKGKHINQKIIVDFNNKKTYLIRGSKCWTRPMKHCMKQFCIPANATSLGELTYGAGKYSLTAQSFAIRMRHMGIFITVTKGNCIPIGEEIVGRVRGMTVMQSLGFFNVTLGIKSPSVFTPPSFCPKTVLMDEELLELDNSFDYVSLKFHGDAEEDGEECY